LVRLRVDARLEAHGPIHPDVGDDREAVAWRERCCV